ncbi:MAG: hypothetical protein VST68_11935 [Nitrospirota bacterium]|nr:hypothetical protein [Nitrospirota bacterium]
MSTACTPVRLFRGLSGLIHAHALDESDSSSRGEWSKKHALSLSEGSALSPAQTQGRQDALFHGQGLSHLDARSVLTVREHGTRARTPLAAFFNIPLDDGEWCPA